MSVFGLTFDVASGSGNGRSRYVSQDALPLLGSVSRTAKIQGSAQGGPGSCAGTVTVVVDRSPYGTVAGLSGIGLAIAAGVLAILFARRRGRGRVSRTLLGGVFGLLAGAGEALVLHEAGVIDPDSRFIGLGPVIGLALGVLLARPWRAGRPALAPPPPFTVPTHAALGRYQPVAELDRSAGLVRYLAGDGDQPAVLLTTVRPDAEDPARARTLFDRHVAVLDRLGGDQLPRVRELLEPAPTLVPTLVTDPGVVSTVRGFLDGQRRFTAEQSATVLRDVLTGLTAVHAAGLVHRDVTPSAIHLHPAEGAMLGTFEQARPGDADVEEFAVASVYLSPEQRRRERLDPRSDLYSCGVVLAELLVGAEWDGRLGDLPPSMAALIQRATADEPDDRPPTAQAFLTELDEAASAAYGPDWMTIGALTGAILVPGGAIVAAGSVIGAGSAAVAAGGTSALQAGATGALSATASNPALGTGATIAVNTVKTGASKAAAGVPAMAGGVVAAVIAVVATVAAPAPAAAADEVLDPAKARIITVNTWTEARGGNKTHLDGALDGGLGGLLALPGVGVAELSDVTIGIPRNQTGYPAYFLATASAKLSDGRTVYLVVRFSRAAADQPWKLVQLYYDTDKTNVPVPGIDPDGYLVPTPPPGQLVLAPDGLAQLYTAWGNRVAASGSVGADPVLALAPGTSFLRTTADYTNVHAVHFFNRFAFSGGGVQPGMMLADGTLLVEFTAKATEELYNRPAPAAGPCDTGAGRFTVSFSGSGMPGGEYRQLHVDWTITGTARIPVKGAHLAGETADTAGKAVIQDSSYVPSNPRSVAC
jgi:hypothetical protein